MREGTSDVRLVRSEKRQGLVRFLKRCRLEQRSIRTVTLGDDGGKWNIG